MATSKIAGIRWVESSIVVIVISSNELTIQGINMYFRLIKMPAIRSAAHIKSNTEIVT